jgi:DNA-binding Lrp family transcriptional regulator
MSKISAMLLIGTETGSERNVYTELSNHNEIEFVNELFGSWDIIAKVQTEDMQRMDEFISDVVRNIPGVNSSVTLIIAR